MVVKREKLLYAIILLNFSLTSWAYKEVVHQEITEKSLYKVENFLLDFDWLKSALGIQIAFNKSNPINLYPEESIVGLIRQGAFEEDDGIRALNHFFDPVHDHGFDFLLPYDWHITGVASPDWMFEQNLELASINIQQDNSYLDALDYFQEALLSEKQEQRRSAWRKLFITLGHLVHHIQDMSQPQHVRNDAHLDRYPFLIGIYNPSLYEIFTREWSGFDEEGNRIAEDKLYYQDYSVDHFDFNTALDFWRNDLQTGIAEFTNSNFFSDATIFIGSQANSGTYPEPKLILSQTSTQKIDIQDICASYPLFCPEDSEGLSGFVTLIGSQVRDNYTSETFNNPWSVSHSIFDKYLEEEGILFDKYIYALNRFNYLAAQSILIPRATAYSTAMLNHFFRGSLEISLPDESVYALVDHAVENTKDTSGFRQLKMKIRNTTETGEQTAPNGLWFAIARFHRNDCYESNLSGEYGSPGMTWQNCRSEEEEVLSSRMLALPSMGKDDEFREVTFSFDKPIPINASDLYLQLMYRGPLGEEDDVVMVATKDISEPSYIAFYNTLDQWRFNGWSFKERYCRNSDGSEIPYEECRRNHWVSDHYRFSEPSALSGSKPTVNEFVPLFSIAEIPVGSYGRVAVLSDVPSYTAFSLLEYWNDDSIYNPNDVVSVIQNQYDLLSSRLEPIYYFKFRGAYIDQRYINNVANGDDMENLPDFSPLEPVPSVIYSMP